MEENFYGQPGDGNAVNPIFYSQPPYNIEGKSGQFMSQEINGTTYYDGTGAAPIIYHETYQGPPVSEHPSIEFGRRGRGRGRGRFNGPSHSDSYWDHGYYYNTGNYDFHNNYMPGQPEDSSGSHANQHQSARPKFRSYQESRQGRHRGDKTYNNSHHAQTFESAPINYPRDQNHEYGGPNRSTRGNRQKQGMDRNTQGYSGGGRRRQNQNWNQGGHPRHNRKQDGSGGNVEDMSYSYSDEYADNKRKWEHETTGRDPDESNTKEDPNKPKFTALGKTKLSKQPPETKEQKTSNQGFPSDRVAVNQPTMSQRKYQGKSKNFRKNRGKNNEEDEETQRGIHQFSFQFFTVLYIE